MNISEIKKVDNCLNYEWRYNHRQMECDFQKINKN